MKLELKHIAPYLPYKLKVVEWYRGKQIHDEFIVDCVNWDGKNIGGSNASLDSFELERAFNLRDVKLILRPLSSMTKEEFAKLKNKLDGGVLLKLTPKGDMYIKCNDEIYLYEVNILNDFLLSNHFDVFGLIDSGLAIDINSLK